ncbi:hypothetical protein BG011_000658 [Mortierella polycephala]|uniref:Adhesin domain-containing protein n=1 Tax=Mortierella polycephala TaxID=41804 RepID=A0A9P6PM75_9FUNG|nr:hypothetical protein BG011_000658 [Mortierella polycephala]
MFGFGRSSEEEDRNRNQNGHSTAVQIDEDAPPAYTPEASKPHFDSHSEHPSQGSHRDNHARDASDRDESDPLLGSGSRRPYWVGYFYVCVIPEDAKIVTFNQTIDPSQYTNLFFHLDRGITGDVIITQSRDRAEQNIQILVTTKASTAEMLQHIASSFDFEPRSLRAESKFFMDMESSDLKRALSKNCTWIEVDVILPYRLGSIDSLEIQSTFKGGVQIRMDQVSITDKLIVKAKEGDVTLKDTKIGKELNLVADGGRVEARGVTIDKVVRINARREVDLELDSKSSSLDVKVSSAEYAQVVLMRSYWGHIALKSYFDPPELVTRQCCFYTRKSNDRSLEGYFSITGFEPWGLPKVEIKGDYSARLEVRG